MRRGFTLVELLVVMAVLGLVMAAVLNVYMTGTSVGLSGENKAEAQQAARAAMLMEEDLRLAGYGFPPTQPKIVAATPTSITFWADLTNASTVLTTAVNPGNTALTVQSASGFKPGDSAYLINYTQYSTVAVTAASGTTVSVGAPGAPAAFPAGVQVGRPKLVTYSWDGVGTLSKDAGDGAGPQPVTAGVQAFQLTYLDATDTPIAPAVLGANLANIRRLVITMTARSATVENRGTFTLASSVRPRNL